EWREAQLSVPISETTWVQWVVAWDATPGEHTIAVRATDGEGIVQEELSSPPAPDGARGWHTVRVNVG
ncbi:MAG: molybdopterin-binding oxidoreductase, partial [Candidatus Limnocylindrales bacterium]